MSTTSDYTTQTAARLTECLKDIAVAKTELHKAYQSLQQATKPTEFQVQNFKRRDRALNDAEAYCKRAQVALQEIEK